LLRFAPNYTSSSCSHLDDERLQLILHEVKGNLICQQHIILQGTQHSSRSNNSSAGDQEWL
jgi:hypothetical protein